MLLTLAEHHADYLVAAHIPEEEFDLYPVFCGPLTELSGGGLMLEAGVVLNAKELPGVRWRLACFGCCHNLIERGQG